MQWRRDALSASEGCKDGQVKLPWIERILKLTQELIDIQLLNETKQDKMSNFDLSLYNKPKEGEKE